MRSFRSAPLPALVTAALLTGGGFAAAQQAPVQAQGFAVDRFYPSAPGAGWFVMDTLDTRGSLGGVAGLTLGYAHDELRVRTPGGAQRLEVVGDEALADFGLAATYERFRLYINLDMPLDVSGNGGTIGGYQFVGPNANQQFTPSGVNPSTAPDALADGRIGIDARVYGEAHDPLRLGVSAQLLIPSPNTPDSEYLSDGTFRAMGRALFAGEVGLFTYAGQLGVHVRPRDDSPTPGGPQGSELLFGVAAGPRLPVGNTQALALVVGPEVYGATAFRSFFGSGGTAVEGLLSGRVEGTAENGGQLRLKLGVGAGLDPRFGAPEWRVVVGIELFDHSNAPKK